MAAVSGVLPITVILLTVLVQMTLQSAGPILFPDNPEFPSYKDRTTSTTRAPVVVHNPRRGKSRFRGGGYPGTDPNRKKQLTPVSTWRQHQRDFRYDRREPTGRNAAPLPRLVGSLPSSGSFQTQSSRRSTVTTRDGTPVVMEMGPNVGRLCPRRTGRFPIMRHCDKYLDCVFNVGYLRSCAEGTKFDYRSATCNFPYRVRCVDDFELYSGIPDQVSAASTLPPLTPAVMERPTAILNPDGSVSTQCPLAAGMFAVPGRCDSFLNCWEGRGYVQQCAPGTLFNCHTEKCDFPHKVRCVQQDMPQPPMVDISAFARSLPGDVAPRSRFGAVMAPPSGQRLRIRGGRSMAQGHVQMYHEGQWSHVCEDGFTRHMADTVCWDLGFTRGSEQLSMKTSLRFKLARNARIMGLQCEGNETHLHECKKRAQDTCKVVGVRCVQNSLSSCPAEYRLFQDSCYKVHATERKSREDARIVCERDGGNLVTIETQTEADFVSELLQYVPNIGCLYTAGVGVALIRQPLWIWETTETHRIQYQRWWPGWNRQSEGEAPSLGSGTKCLILQNNFPSPPLSARSSRTRNEITRNMDAGYFWWTAGDCLENLAFVCEAPQVSIGCIRRNGGDYRGNAAATETGRSCLQWNNPAIGELTRQLNLNTEHIGEHNYCRNPDGDDRPWCFISARDYDFCDIPRCQPAATSSQDAGVIGPSLRSGNSGASVDTATACGDNMFQCRPGECKFFSWVCDGEEDCSNGKDEADCHDHLGDYKHTPQTQLIGYEVEKWLFTEKKTCARRCSETKDFLCRAFNYYEAEQTCYLLDSNLALSGTAEQVPEFELYELLSEIPDCSHQFVCPTGKCLNTSQVCDGRRDCPDNDDEADCLANIEFDIRLADGKKPSEGRVEVKAMGRWGVVCDDLFSVVDGDVICRHLGYSLGAVEVVTNAGFGSGNGRFLMDDLNCRGDEQKLVECDFAGWGKSDCSEAEVAGVRCREAGMTCTDTQWRCRSGKCVDMTYVCDQVDDCGDFSDEEDKLCKLPLTARLVGGTNSSGRVEVRYKGVWGTVCDDDFDSEDAQVVCRMLGFEGAAIVHKNGMYGSGRGQIWLDQLSCAGKEKSVDECYHLPWGQSNCAHEEDVGVECTETFTGASASSSAPDPVPRDLMPAVCGRRYTPDTPIVPLDQNPKIVSGKVTEPGSHPWMVGVRIRAGIETAHWCGAVIISEYHILSAAHCLLDYPQQVYVLRVGDYDNQEPDPQEQEFTIERMYPHPGFNKGTYLNNDLVVIRVKPVRGRGIVFGSQVQPVCLSPASVPYEPGKKCTIAGWGSTGRRAGYARRLQSVMLPLLPLSTCRAPHVYGESKITDGMYCAGYLEGGIDTCQGDSGGPMVCDHDGVNILYGVTSWGQGCARPNKPGVYTKITSYLNWIYRTIELDQPR